MNISGQFTIRECMIKEVNSPSLYDQLFVNQTTFIWKQFSRLINSARYNRCQLLSLINKKCWSYKPAFDCHLTQKAKELVKPDMTEATLSLEKFSSCWHAFYFKSWSEGMLCVYPIEQKWNGLLQCRSKYSMLKSYSWQLSFIIIHNFTE